MVKYNKGKTPIFILLGALFLCLITAAVDGQAMASIIRVLDKGFRGSQVNSPQINPEADNNSEQNTYQAEVDSELNLDNPADTQTQAPLPDDSSMKQISYKVLMGDTLDSIARKYKTSINEIMKLNKLSSVNIYTGTILLVPQNSVQEASVSKVQTSAKKLSSAVSAPQSLAQVPSRSMNRYGELADWWTVVSSVFARGDTATVTDLNTGLKYQVVRKGGTNHADAYPKTAADTAIMLKIYGGQWSWARRAVLVSIDGRTFAASQNGMPHGQREIWTNDFPGHFCIHFLNSRTHGTDKVDPAHQAAVRRAAGLTY